MTYKIIFVAKIEKQLKKISKKDAQNIIRKIDNLATNPRSQDVKKLSGFNLYRIRSGNYRIVYQIKDKILSILIVTVAHRKDIYRELSDINLHSN